MIIKANMSYVCEESYDIYFIFILLQELISTVEQCSKKTPWMKVDEGGWTCLEVDESG